MPSDDHYDAWREAAVADPSYTPMPEEEIRAAFLWTSQNGPPNCWTGTTGHAAAIIRRLLRERAILLESLNYHLAEDDLK